MPADHSTPEGRRCPECGGSKAQRAPICRNAFHGPTPAPEGGVPCEECEQRPCICNDGEARTVNRLPTSAEGGEAEPNGKGRTDDPNDESVRSLLREMGADCHMWGHGTSPFHPGLARSYAKRLLAMAEAASPSSAATGEEDHWCELDDAFLDSLARCAPDEFPSLMAGKAQRHIASLRRQLAEAEAKREGAEEAMDSLADAVKREAERATTAERRLEEAEAKLKHEDAAYIELARWLGDAGLRLTASQQEVARLTEELAEVMMSEDQWKDACAREQDQRLAADREVARLHARVGRLTTACAFFASCVKSGEGWSEACEQIRAEALSTPQQGEEPA